MAAIEITISGILYDKIGRTTQPVVLIGEASLTGLGVGGGPIPPQGGQPPTIWPPPFPSHPIVGPGDPSWGGPPSQPPARPAFPIWGPPGITFPPGSGYPPVAGHPLPPDQPAPQPIPGWEAKPVWSPDTGWAVVIVPKPGTEVPTPSAKK